MRSCRQDVDQVPDYLCPLMTLEPELSRRVVSLHLEGGEDGDRRWRIDRHAASDTKQTGRDHATNKRCNAIVGEYCSVFRRSESLQALNHGNRGAVIGNEEAKKIINTEP